MEKRKETKLICACSNCKNSKHCIGKVSCYRLVDKQNCPQNNCFGCFNSFIQAFQCGYNSENVQITCCNQKNFCNLNSSQTKSAHIFQTESGSSDLIKISVFLIPLVLLLLLSLSLSVVYLFCSRKQTNKSSLKQLKQVLKQNAVILKQTESEKSENYLIQTRKLEETSSICSLTSGYSPDELIQRTIARDVHIDYDRGIIGKGRYGIVWHGKWNVDSVAVKVFFSMHEQSWSRETELYQTSMLRHDNILRYIASDIKGHGSSINMLLITDYHSNGSLYDYLTLNIIENEQSLLKFAYSIINGLNHLHQEIIGTYYKPVIVHRDLKTKNVLVKSNMECCLADFGLAVRYSSERNQIDFGKDRFKLSSIQEGSVRYMAPECLKETLNMNSIEQLKKTDIYSYALIVWELLSRFRIDNDEINEHRPAYYEFVQGDPPIELMCDIVCIRKLRPSLKINYMTASENLKQLHDIMTECWKEEQNARLNALNIKKKLQKCLE